MTKLGNIDLYIEEETEGMKKCVSVLVALVAFFVAAPAFAEGGAATGSADLIAIGAGLAIGLAALGGTMGQSKAVSSALDSIGRNPSAAGKIFTPMIIGLVLIESLVILSFVVANTLAGKM